MSVRIRLARHGKKRFAYYHIVIADSRAPRDGRFIERIGTYNPNTNPATINIEFDKAMEWLDKGAQPTETVRAILSYKGILMKRHLLGGVKKGAFSEEEAEKRFQEWLKQKEAKIDAKRERIAKERDDMVRKRVERETKISDARAEEILKKASKLAEEEQKDAGVEAPAVEDEVVDKEVAADEPEAKPAAEEKMEETVEQPVEETDAGDTGLDEPQEQVTSSGEPEAEPADEEPVEETQETDSGTEGEEVDNETEGKELPEKPEEDTKEEKS
ncbi:MAG: hypothetical protein AMS27_01920 [Bacteroides sp. SM23_62_1]|nr:MAG: hypothetical protein AMS27_01920 [Bacteroides sp. SM23_62_1]